MTQSSYPFDGLDTSETEFSIMFRELQDTGVVGSAGDNALKVTADSSGLNASVAAGVAFVRGIAYRSTAIESLAFGSGVAQPRIDTVILRLDPTANSIVLAVLPGVASTTPAPPARLQTDTGIYELPLADVRIQANAVTVASADVADLRRRTSNRVGAWTTALRPVAPRVSQLGLNTDTGLWEYWTQAGGWADLAPTVNWSTIAGLPSSFTPAAHNQDWSTVTGKPSSFTPAAHNQDWSTVTGKPTAFNPTGHTHPDLLGNGSNLGYIRWGGQRPVAGGYAGGGEVEIATSADLAASHAGASVAYANDAGGSRYTQGPNNIAYNRSIGSGYFAAYMDNSFQFGRNVSSRRYKEDIAQAVIDVDAVLSLEPVTYHRKADTSNTSSRDIGLIAEDSVAVEHLVIWDQDPTKPEGTLRPEGIRYETVLPVALLAVVKAQAKQIADLSARLDSLEVAM